MIKTNTRHAENGIINRVGKQKQILWHAKTLQYHKQAMIFFFSVEIFNSNGAYEWKLIDSATDNEEQSGKGDTEKYEIKPLVGDANCVSKSLILKVAPDSLGVTMRVSVYHGTGTQSVMLIDKFETTLAFNPSTHRINFLS